MIYFEEPFKEPQIPPEDLRGSGWMDRRMDEQRKKEPVPLMEEIRQVGKLENRWDLNLILD